MSSTISEHDLGKLRWRCRRGMLENDLILDRFFRKYGERLTSEQARDLLDLMEFSDRELLDLLLRRTALPAGAATKEKARLVDMLQSP